jgi:hypothetical protein
MRPSRPILLDTGHESPELPPRIHPLAFLINTFLVQFREHFEVAATDDKSGGKGLEFDFTLLGFRLVAYSEAKNFVLILCSEHGGLAFEKPFSLQLQKFVRSYSETKGVVCNSKFHF